VFFRAPLYKQQITFQNLQDAYAPLHVKNRVLGIIEEPVAIENIEKI
jgi:hypothetical protein